VSAGLLFIGKREQFAWDQPLISLMGATEFWFTFLNGIAKLFLAFKP
jgi:hypothetical protein